MSVLMSAGKKAAQAKEKDLQKKKKAEAAKKSTAARSSRGPATAVAVEGPPMSSPVTSVWYWMLDGRPTTVMYYKTKKEVWCNGYLIDTYEGFQDDEVEDLSEDVGDIVDFDIFSPDTQRSHRGRIERVPVHQLSWPACESPNGLVVGSHRLWVDDCHIPEYTDNSRVATDYSSQDYFQDYYDDDDDEYSLSGSGGLHASFNNP